MSIQLVGWALEQRTGSVSRKAVLIALANCTNHHTGLCCPSIKRIRAETELGESTVLRALTDLEDAGYITRDRRLRENGSFTTTVYRFPHSDQGVPPERGKGSPTVTPLEPEVEPEVKPSAAAPRARKPIWDCLSSIFGEPTTRSAQKVRGKVCAELAATQATPEEIIRRAKRWRLHFQGATMTDLSLAKHWDTLERSPLK